ncbi:MAG: glycosyltransferase family 2 protein [Ignisphaera sp.]
MLPKVSIIWLNYNSNKIIDIVLESLEGIADLDYPNNRYELIVVDNGSSDGSFETISNFLEERTGLKKKVIRLDRNLGFTGGCNVGFRARDPESKYVMLLNNDAIPFKNSINALVECAEQIDGVGAAQGVILDLDTKKVDTAGGILTELLIGGQLYQGRDVGDVKNRIFYVTYADGAYALLKVNAVKRITGFRDRLFYDKMFAYFDDCILGLQLWNAGFKVMSCPIPVAYHRRSSTFGRVSPMKLYYTTRGFYATNEVCNSRFKYFIRKQHFVYTILGRAILGLSISSLSKVARKQPYPFKELIWAVYKGYVHGIKMGRAIVNEMGKPIDIYKAPLLNLSTQIVLPYILGVGSIVAKRIFVEIVTREFEKHISSYIVE